MRTLWRKIIGWYHFPQPSPRPAAGQPAQGVQSVKTPNTTTDKDQLELKLDPHKEP